MRITDRFLLVLPMAVLSYCGHSGNSDTSTITTSQDAGPVTQFVATSATNKVNLSWTNPAQAIQAIKIVRKAGSYPANKDDGTQVYSGTSTATADTTTNNYTEYFYSAYTIGESGNVAGPANTKSASCPAALTCPSGYVLVPGNSSVGAYCPFCVAQYEMRRVNDVATSQASGASWPQSGQNLAKTNCTSIGTGYHLMTNSERLAIAKDIEGVASNWTGGSVGSGSISKGYQASTSYGDAWSNPAGDPPESTAANLYNTGAHTCASTGNALYRRTLTLSNGSVLWDFIGGRAEWVDWTEGVPNVPIASVGSCDTNGTGCEFSTVVAGSTTPQSLWKPASSYDSTKGFGLYFKSAGPVGGVPATSLGALSGGYWDKGGLYNLEFMNVAFVGPQTGFRCAYIQ